MKKLITFELRKLLKNKSFYICLIISSVLVFLNALLTKSIAEASESGVDPNSIILTFAANGMLTMITGIFTAIFITDDYTCGTMKNIYAKGYSRNEVYLSKYIVSSIATLVFLILSLLVSILSSESLFHGETVQNDTFFISIVLQFVLMLAYNSLFFLISMVIGKLGSSIAFCIVGPSVVSLLLTIVDSFLKLNDFRFSSYWLDNCLSSVQTVNCSSSVILSSVIISLAVIAVSVIAGLKLNAKKEF